MYLGTYAHVAGYDEYITDIRWVIKQYRCIPGQGPQMESVLKVYLDGKEEEEQRVYEMVKKAQEEANASKGAGSTEIIRSSLRQLSKQGSSSTRIESSVSEELLEEILKDQSLQRQTMSEGFFSIMKMKTTEYERQLAEGVDSASVTKEENERFRETFISSPVPVRPRPVAIGQENSPRCKIM